MTITSPLFVTDLSSISHHEFPFEVTQCLRLISSLLTNFHLSRLLGVLLLGRPFTMLTGQLLPTKHCAVDCM